MKKLTLCLYTLLVLLTPLLRAQDIVGDWQGTIQTKTGLRVILHVEKVPEGEWKATLFSIDQSTNEIPVTTITLHGSELVFSLASLNASYKGKLDDTGTSFAGEWTQGKIYPLNFERATKATAWPRDATPHTISFVNVEKDVKLEVIDWGGSGRPLVFLTGLGDNAHVFDRFAPKFIATYHVYGITRRGFGISSSPPPVTKNYAADRLGDDVLAVIDALQLKRPVLVGHSIAGEELSSIGTRYPEKVAGLIYLDAGNSYAFYDRARGNATLDALDVKEQLDELVTGPNAKDALAKLLVSLPQLDKELQDFEKEIAGLPSPPKGPIPEFGPVQAVLSGEQRYTKVNIPVLAIFASPHNLGSLSQYTPATQAAMTKYDLETTTRQIDAFEAGVPSAHVVRIPNANHYLYLSNEPDVFKEMNSFLDKLPM
jgi:non-heme chloroperoxidase